MPYNTSHTTNTHKPQNQTQKRCSHPLCNTQHTTTPQPPQPPPHPHTLEPHRLSPRDALDGPRPEAAPRKPPPTGKVSPQDPTVCRTMFHDFWRCVPPSHTPPTCAGCGNNKKENPQRHVAGLPPHTGKLLRKEVIQPHLPVRLPCYDFVPIAGPTFDHSPPQVG